MTDENSTDFQADVLAQLAALNKEVLALKTMLYNTGLNADVRNLLAYSPMEIALGEIRTSKFDRRAMELIYETELPKLAEILPRVMGTIDASDTSGERAGPNDFATLRNGHFRTMLMRYIAPSKIFCEGKKVLDCCCGRGWGTMLVSHYAREIDAIDLDPELISTNRDYWGDTNINWMQGDVLADEHFQPNHYDVVLGMEIIEHFTREEGEVLLNNILKSLRPGGFFAGSSAYPNNRAHADNHPALRTDGHKFLWTAPELREYLEPHCESVSVINNWMLVFQKRN